MKTNFRLTMTDYLMSLDSMMNYLSLNLRTTNWNLSWTTDCCSSLDLMTMTMTMN